MVTATRVQIQDEAVSISHSANIFGKRMNVTILSPAIEDRLGSLTFVWQPVEEIDISIFKTSKLLLKIDLVSYLARVKRLVKIYLYPCIYIHTHMHTHTHAYTHTDIYRRWKNEKFKVKPRKLIEAIQPFENTYVNRTLNRSIYLSKHTRVYIYIYIYIYTLPHGGWVLWRWNLRLPLP